MSLTISRGGTGTVFLYFIINSEWLKTNFTSLSIRTVQQSSTQTEPCMIVFSMVVLLDITLGVLTAILALEFYRNSKLSWSLFSPASHKSFKLHETRESQMFPSHHLDIICFIWLLSNGIQNCI